jgi:hypothetical protein
LNRWHLDEQRKGEVVADLEISREDFATNTDVVPVSDPHIFSETQRMAQMQAVMQLMGNNPDVFNKKKVIERFLKQMKVPAINELMIDVPAPEMRTIADENAAMSIGQPAYAYIQQDHISHIQGHLQFANDPAYGSNPFFAPQFTPNAIEHIKQHMTLWYLNRMNGYVAQSRGGKPVTNYEDVKLTGIIDQVFAAVGQHVSLDTSEVFQQIMPQLQQLMQRAQQFQQPPQLPPDAQVVKDTSMAETQRKAQKDQIDAQFAAQKLQTEQQEHQMDSQVKIAIENAKLMHQAIPPMPMLQPPAQPAEQQPPQPPQGEPNGNIG